jgi:hypothetical protein
MMFLGQMAGFSKQPLAGFERFTYLPNDVALALLFGIAGSVPLVSSARSWLERVRFPRIYPQVGAVMGALEFISLTGVFVAALGLSAAGTYNPFIYFRF